jgi:hypothetical protein
MCTAYKMSVKSIILHCTVFHFTSLHCISLHFTAPCVLQCTALHCTMRTVLYCTALCVLCSSALYCILYFNALCEYLTVLYYTVTALHCTALHCSVPIHLTVIFFFSYHSFQVPASLENFYNMWQEDGWDVPGNYDFGTAFYRVS